MLGKVTHLFITKNDKNKTRNSLNFITVNEAGIIDDKFYNKDAMRSILITSLESYKLCEEHGIHLEYGSLGENILVDIRPYDLLPGDKFTIGQTQFEITQNCTLCQGLSSVHSKLPKLLKHDRGIFAKVISKESTLSLSDCIEI